MPVRATVDHLAALPEPDNVNGATIVWGVRAGRAGDDAPGVDPAVLAAAGFEGKTGQTTTVVTDDGIRLLVGLGDAGPGVTQRWPRFRAPEETMDCTNPEPNAIRCPPRSPPWAMASA